jgi:glycosyltransferase involved in cell wall biosynthesis
MNVSLVIPTYNRDEFLIDTLKCALNQDFDSYEIVVVDQSENHTSETLSFLKEYKDRLVYMTSETPSLTMARNLGVQASKGEVIIMVDDDTLFEKDFIQQHWSAIQSGYDVVSGRVEEGVAKTAKHPVWFNKWGRYYGSGNCLTDGITNFFAGCNGSFKKTVFDHLGGFDECFIKTANCEDADFGYRAYKAGYKLWFKASASVIHRKAITGGVGNRVNYLYLNESYYQNRFYFTKKLFPKYAQLYLRIRLIIKGLKAAYRLVTKAEHEAETFIRTKGN